MSLMTDIQMEGQTAEQQAKKAIAHTLQQIRDNPSIGWYLGFGSQTFSLLTEAAATLWSEPLETVRRNFMPRNAKNPRDES